MTQNLLQPGTHSDWFVGTEGQPNWNVNPTPPTHLLPTYDTTRLIAVQLAIELAKHDESVNIIDAAKSIYKFITGQTNI